MNRPFLRTDVGTFLPLSQLSARTAANGLPRATNLVAAGEGEVPAATSSTPLDVEVAAAVPTVPTGTVASLTATPAPSPPAGVVGFSHSCRHPAV